LIRYLDSRVVSVKGEKFTEVKKAEDESVKNTYINLKPARQYRFHWYHICVYWDLTRLKEDSKLLTICSYSYLTVAVICCVYIVINICVISFVFSSISDIILKNILWVFTLYSLHFVGCFITATKEVVHLLWLVCSSVVGLLKQFGVNFHRTLGTWTGNSWLMSNSTMLLLFARHQNCNSDHFSDKPDFNILLQFDVAR